MKNMKKIALASTMFIVLASSAFADTHSYDGSHNNEMKSSEMKSTASQPPMREINPAAGPRVADGIDFFITASYIFWKTSTGNTDLLISGAQETSTSGLIPVTTTSGSRHTDSTISYGWDSGFKVGAGFNLPHDGWDLAAEYTWLRPNASESVTATPNGNPLQQVPYGTGQAFCTKTISGEETLHFNTINLTLGRNYYVSQYFTMHPFAGVMGTWQTWNATRSGTGIERTGVANNAGFAQAYLFSDCTSSLRLNNDIWGVGILAGLDMGMFFTRKFSAFASLSGASMFQSYQRSDSSNLKGTLSTTVTSHPAEVTVRQDQTNYALLPWLCVELGLKYDGYFDDDQFHFSLQAGWEGQWWSGWLYSALDNQTRDLTLGGLKVKARFDF